MAFYRMRVVVVELMLMAAAGLAAAQITTPSTDVLGAHLNYGRGCAACHAPHSGTTGNGNAKISGSNGGAAMLWGKDVSSLYGKTITTGGGKFVEVLPASLSAGTPDVAGMLTCLSCHDGNYAERAMMKNRLYETLPSTYGTSNSIPTMMGENGSERRKLSGRAPDGTQCKDRLWRGNELGLHTEQRRDQHERRELEQVCLELRILCETGELWEQRGGGLHNLPRSARR